MPEDLPRGCPLGSASVCLLGVSRQDLAPLLAVVALLLVGALSVLRVVVVVLLAVVVGLGGANAGAVRAGREDIGAAYAGDALLLVHVLFLGVVLGDPVFAVSVVVPVLGVTVPLAWWPGRDELGGILAEGSASGVSRVDASVVFALQLSAQSGLGCRCCSGSGGLCWCYWCLRWCWCSRGSEER